MSTRNLTMVVDRSAAEKTELGFACHPEEVGDKSYVNMYLHHDGYPEWQGVQLANWVLANNRADGNFIAAKLVHDMWYDSCYLYTNQEDIDHEYTYIVWTGKKGDIWISCYNQWESQCVFVNKPEDIIKKYKKDMEYTNFAMNQKRFNESLRWKNTK